MAARREQRWRTSCIHHSLSSGQSTGLPGAVRRGCDNAIFPLFARSSGASHVEERVSTEQLVQAGTSTTIDVPVERVRGRARRAMLLVCGTLSLALGVLGIFVPLLPTTCFLLVSAWCYARSSPRLYGWLLGQRYVGAYLRRYRDERTIPAPVKTASLVIMWISIGYGVITVPNLLIRLTLLAIAIGVTIHLVRLPSSKPG